MPAFSRHIGIDYSGAETPWASLKGLRVYQADGDAPPVEVLPPPSPLKYWTRRGIAEWLVARLTENVPTLVGIDHGFSFPMRYFEVHGLPDWVTFLVDFRDHWPTDGNTVWVRDILRGEIGRANQRMGDPAWFRATERRTKSAKSVFNFGQKQGCVAFSTHAGIPWLHFIRLNLGANVHFWPFDGWDIPAGRSAIVEVYPALWNGSAKEGRTADQHDAYCTATWLSGADREGRLSAFLKPNLTPAERTLAEVEGWILGVAVSNTHPMVASVQHQPAIAAVLRPTVITTSSGITRACPECSYVFRGGTWGGIDGHWKAHHNQIMTYEEAWPIIKAGRKPSAE